MMTEKRAGKRKSNRKTAAFYLEQGSIATIDRLWRMGRFDSKSHVVDEALSRVLPEMEREMFAQIVDAQIAEAVDVD